MPIGLPGRTFILTARPFIPFNVSCYSISMYLLIRSFTSVILFVVFLSSAIQAQTCSCAGAPLLGIQSTSAASKGNLLVGLTYQYNDISSIYTGDQKLDNRSVERNTQSTLLEINYGITNRITIAGTASFIRKQRITGLQNQAGGNELITQGLGDGILLLKYVLHKNTMQSQYQLAVGGGAKVPLGKASLENNGIALNADMQPGTGAWDAILWSYLSKTFAPNTTLNLFWFNTFRQTGTHGRFNENDSYRFGNELISTAGISNKLAGKISYVASLRYRSTSSDQLNSTIQPNTGGKWISFKPSLRYQITNSISTSISGKIPLYQYLNGTQPTTTFAANVAVFYKFGDRVIF